MGEVKLMSDSINVELVELGIINGLITTQVINADTGEVIGYNQSAIEESNE
jgi:hypothetical protein